MNIFETVDDLQSFITAQKTAGKTIGFVPTMGALHKGHLSLIKQAKAATNIVVCSIFVNPTQFDNAEDLVKYPRTTERDIALLQAENTEVLFLPNVKEIYPNTTATKEKYDFGYLDQPMEGAYRDGHFDGVAQVVKRLLDIVQPHQLFMGQKDFQQFSIIRRLLELTKSEVQLVNCSIVREADGLAMSSRNVRMEKAERAKAVILSQTLKAAKEWMLTENVATVKQKAIAQIENIEGVKIDYFEIIDADTLRNIQNWEEAENIIACVAAHVKPVRLIDNLFLKKK